MTVELQTQHNSEIISASSNLEGPQWLRDRRAIYATQFGSMDMPTSKEEIWRYSEIDSFDLTQYHPVGNLHGVSTPGGGVVANEAGQNSSLVVLKDGQIVHCHVSDEMANAGVVVCDIADVQGEHKERVEKYFGTIAQESSDTFVVLNETLLASGVYVYVPKSVVVEFPIVIVHWSQGKDIIVSDRVFNFVEDNASVSIIERFESDDESKLITSVTESMVGANSQVRYLTTQENGKEVTHIGLHRAHLYRDSNYEASTVSLGSKYSRLRREIVLCESGANSEVKAVYYGDNDQLIDFRTLQDHRAPNTTSDLLFKGAVEDNARSVYSGMIHIRKDAQKTNAYQTNHNLVLSEGAHAKSIPNLRIEANDVRCSHGSTVGPIDENQMYYLATRGVSPQDAEKLIVLGFFEDIFSKLSIPSLVEPLRRRVREKISTLSGEHHEG